MKRTLAFFACSALISAVFPQAREVRVGILRGTEARHLLAQNPQGSMFLLIDGDRAGEISAKDGLRISIENGKLIAKSLSRTFHPARSMSLRIATRGVLRVNVLDEPKATRDYTGTIDVQRAGDALLIVNTVPLEEYVAGVVQSEAGDNKGIEYYKLQAVSCRTWALANLRRHLPDDFAVCDGTHCQVYKGRCTLDPVRQAVDATRNMVVVDAGIHLITATFHSNCGGETMNAEDLWSKSEPYLVSEVDTFCLNSPHAAWHRTMPKTNWLTYLHRTYGIDTNDSMVVRSVTDFAPRCRSLYIDGARPLIPLEQVRADMKFNSAWFTIWPAGDDVVFDGRGYGHGVGLCQEGAMRMANSGHSFIEILHHYFAEVHLVDLNTLDFFRDEGF